MVLVVADWLYMFIMMLVVGTSTLHIIVQYIFKDNIKVSPYYCVVCGYVVLTIYAEIFSIFHKVGILANSILLVISIILGFFFYKKIWNVVRELLLAKWWKWFVVIGVFTFLLTISGTPILLFSSGDTGLYHSQAVRWIEEYGCVKGLGNLVARIGYNNASFCLAALFSMYELTGTALRTTVTFFCGITISKGIIDLFCMKFHSFYIADGIRIMMLIYTLYKSIFLVGYSTDGLVTYMVFSAAIAFCEIIESEVNKILPYGFLCLYIIYIATVKLSAAAFGVVILWGVWELIKNKKSKELMIFSGMGGIILAPFLVRNVILTGYLIYPLSMIDIFDVDWKIPKQSVAYMEYTTSNFAKAQYLGVGYKEAANAKISEWFPRMIEYLLGTFKLEKLIGIMLIISIICIIISGIIQLVLTLKGKNDTKVLLPLKVSCVVATLYCLFKAPDSRFLAHTVLILPIILVFQYFNRKKILQFIGGKFYKKIIFECTLIILGCILFWLIKGEINSQRCYLQWHDFKQFLVNPGYVYSDSRPWEYTSRMPENGCVYKEDCYEVAEVDGLKIFYQTSSTSYHFAFWEPFPAVIMKENLVVGEYGNLVHARGDDYRDGFWGEYIGGSKYRID